MHIRSPMGRDLLCASGRGLDPGQFSRVRGFENIAVPSHENVAGVEKLHHGALRKIRTRRRAHTIAFAKDGGSDWHSERFVRAP